MNNNLKMIFVPIILFLFVSPVSAEQGNKYSNNDDLPEICFFPSSIARYDGYSILPKDWRSLGQSQKKRFINEGIMEIEQKENCTVEKYNIDELLEPTDKLNYILALSGFKIPSICVLFKVLEEDKKIVYKNGGRVQLEQRALDKKADYSGIVEFSRSYIGYIEGYEKNNFWLKNPPEIEKIEKDTIFAKCVFYPSSVVVLSERYPSGFDYKITSREEIASFPDEDGTVSHYYKVVFMPVDNSNKSVSKDK